MDRKALEGIRVLDLTSALSGPFGTMFFGDFGAEVIKIEPVGGEQCRTWGPIDEKSGESGFFAYVNRNKKGCTLNLKSEKGLNMFYELVKTADLVWENYRGGVTEKLKIDYPTLKKINPKLIYVSGSGFGQTSPYSHRACYDIVAQAMAGLVYMTGFPSENPVKVGASIADHVSGIYQAVGALIALYDREKTGKGQLVDVSMVDTIFSMLENAIPSYTMKGEIAERKGNIDPSIAPFDIYTCKDGYVAFGVGNEKLWKKLCQLIDREDLLEKEEFRTNELRVKNYTRGLQQAMQEWASAYTKNEIETIMDEAGIPCGPVLNIKEAIEHPHIQARQMMVHQEHPLLGDVYMQGIVPKLSETPGGLYDPAPLLGQDNREVFHLSESEEKALKEEGVI